MTQLVQTTDQAPSAAGKSFEFANISSDYFPVAGRRWEQRSISMQWATPWPKRRPTLSRWDAAMDMAADAAGNSGAILFDAKGHLPGIPKSRRMGPPLEAYVKDGWIDRDDRYKLLPLMVRKGAVSELEVLTPEEIARHPYRQELLAPFGLWWFAGVKVAAGDDLWCLSIQQGPFSPSEMQRRE